MFDFDPDEEARKNLEEWARDQERRNAAKRQGLFQVEKGKERRLLVFERWQKMRRARFKNLLPPTGDNRFCVCACGHPKECAKKRCYDCQDMWAIVKQRIPMSGAVDVAERYGRIHETPLLHHDVDHRSSRFEESENCGSLHNIIRAMEDFS